MQTAKLSEGWQITIPEPIRRKLNLKIGDKVMFLESEDTVTIKNSSIAALERFQNTMEGEAEKVGIYSDADVLALCDEIRKELYEKHYANHA